MNTMRICQARKIEEVGTDDKKAQLQKAWENGWVVVGHLQEMGSYSYAEANLCIKYKAGKMYNKAQWETSTWIQVAIIVVIFVLFFLLLLLLLIFFVVLIRKHLLVLDLTHQRVCGWSDMTSQQFTACFQGLPVWGCSCAWRGRVTCLRDVYQRSKTSMPRWHPRDPTGSIMKNFIPNKGWLFP